MPESHAYISSSHCYVCMEEYQQNYYELHGNTSQTYQQRRRDYAYKLFNNRCNECGSQENLEIDHIDPNTKSTKINKSVFCLSDGDFFEEIKKCQLLCKRCHSKKNASEMRKEQHGTWSEYSNQGCRCDACREAAKRYRKSYYQKVGQ